MHQIEGFFLFALPLLLLFTSSGSSPRQIRGEAAITYVRLFCHVQA